MSDVKISKNVLEEYESIHLLMYALEFKQKNMSKSEQEVTVHFGRGGGDHVLKDSNLRASLFCFFLVDP